METGFSLALSFILGGILLVSILSFNSNISQTAILNNMDLSAQTKLQGMVEIVKNDLRKVGYRIDPEQSDEIISNEEDRIVFRTDIDTARDNRDPGKIELFQNDSVLVRNVFDESTGMKVDSESVSIGGLREFNIGYYTSDGDSLQESGEDASDIRSFKVTIVSGLHYTYDPGDKPPYKPKAYWQSEIYPKNIAR